ncbi:winged helix-turn-helix domain-containing protein [Nitrospirillum sp. BR 11164]|uniref:ATP-binding protein n=1 Tax=Nitrospirillum sp. BR 11164 TaxID=3104324 RepID=UPI002AFEE979|nr:winged helix-turn-helix domain-containing protein [Nitrospirillum sp. BR 11164]MEA1648882.1 winged helix-turn-helix domain-containing protein [Nitrospirillum sp. BR 11164]
MATAVDEREHGLAFGPFKLVMSERLLTRDGVPVDVGARALDILSALVATPNEVINKRNLMSLVWPDVIVEEASLRFHIANLRKALGDGVDGARYITTIPGRGYCFVAPITRTNSPRKEPPATTRFQHANLPPRLGRMIGRDEDVMALWSQLADGRLVTIIGPGGVGKTTVAVAVAHHLAAAFSGAVLFVDFGMITDPRLAATAVTSLLGLSVQSDDPTPSLVQFLKDKRVLLILDTCEHLVEAIADLAAAVTGGAPDVHILATSREALRIEGERVYRLDALAYPTDISGLSAIAVQQFPATQLFMERAMASGARLEVNDAKAAVVCHICRKLDGMALAIELAARRVEAYGLEQTAALLDQRLTLLWHGLRTAPPRQKTLQATLDWSYELLSDVERRVLRRLAVFVGHFTLEAALDVVAGGGLDQAAVFEAVDSLVEKSMVAARPIGAMMRYRLLDTTRAYAIETHGDDGEGPGLAARHAAYYRRWLEQTGNEWSSLSTGLERAPHFAALNNVRAALAWCFGDGGDVSIGIGLAAAAAPVFRTMALVPECHRWSERALGAMEERHRGGPEEMQLQAALGLSLMFTLGHGEAVIAALHRSLDIARAHGDTLNEARLLGPLHFFHLRSGDFRACLRYAERCMEITAPLGDPEATALAHTLMGMALHILGDLGRARVELDAALSAENPSGGRQIHFGFDHRNWANLVLVTTLWMQGHPTQARALIHQQLRDIETMHHPVAFALMVNAVATLLWIGDLDVAEARLDWLVANATSQSFAPYRHVGQAFQAELAIRRGDIDAGAEKLRAHLDQLHAARYELFTGRFFVVLADGLAKAGRWQEAMAQVHETARFIETTGYTSYIPELLRVKGCILIAAPGLDDTEAEACLLDSLQQSRTQGSGSWELRAATDLATLWASQGFQDRGRALLRSTLERFAENDDVPDVNTARDVLALLE